MFISRRSIARSTALTLAAATFAACGDSTGPLDLSPTEFESIGESVATEIEGGAMSLTGQDAMGTVGSPVLSLQGRQPRQSLSRAAFRRQSASLMAGTDCGVPSQNPPVDTDGDQVPDNFSVTFALPACHIDDQTGGYMEITGLVRLSDPQPGTAGMALNLSLDNMQIKLSSPDASGTVTRDGSASVSASTSGLSQTQDWTQTARITGLPAIGVDINWAATFAAAQGQSITAGQPLPDGTYQPNGSIRYQEGKRASSFSVTTVTPLQYSATCAAGIANGTAMTPFTAGQVDVAFSDQGRSGKVSVTYADCNYATVQFVAQ
jgi:hypothetical protein